ncbi:MAG: hypothetical protein SF029_15110 [bacterium]|nr:hypothetical protein [bacterium]
MQAQHHRMIEKLARAHRQQMIEAAEMQRMANECAYTPGPSLARLALDKAGTVLIAVGQCLKRSQAQPPLLRPEPMAPAGVRTAP